MRDATPPEISRTAGSVRLAAAGGLALASALGVAAVARRDRPLHSYGQSYRGVLQVDRPAGVGVPLLDTARATHVVVRLSRAASLNHRGPDVMGIALRVPGETGSSDLLFASTGTGIVTRHLLTLHRAVDAGPVTTLLPASTSTGPLLLSLVPREAGRWELAWSRPGVPAWTPCGTLTLREPYLDPGHFDPTGRAPEGMEPPAWVLRLRDPAYRWARRLVRLPRR